LLQFLRAGEGLRRYRLDGEYRRKGEYERRYTHGSRFLRVGLLAGLSYCSFLKIA